MAFIGHALMGCGRGHAWIGSGCPREERYLWFPHGPVLSQAHGMTDGTSSKHAYVMSLTARPVCFALILQVTFISEAIFIKYILCSYLVSGERQVLGSCLKGGPVHLNLSSGLNSSPNIKINVLYWIRQKKQIHLCFCFSIN